MRALVVNDDGVDSVGIHTLATVAVQAGHEVLIAAPHTERSGSSAAFSALEDDGRLVVHETRLDGLQGVRALGIEGTPALIAFLACHGAFGSPPDLVLSGVNHGPNLGHAVLHSGTVGAALTAAAQGTPAMAVSLAAAKPTHWATAAQVSRQSLDRLVQGIPPGTVLNVNVPDVPPGLLRGLQEARLAAFGAVQADIGEVGEGFVTVTFRETDEELEPGTDAAWLHEGWATATVVHGPTEHGGDPDGLAVAVPVGGGAGRPGVAGDGRADGGDRYGGGGR